MSQHIINFSFNWNKKLDCNAFTTLRIHNPEKYIKEHEYEIQLKGIALGLAKIIDIKILKPDNFTEFVAFLDTGYSKAECIEIIRKMYPKIDVMKTNFDFILLQKIKKQVGKSEQFNPLDHEQTR